MRMARQLEVNGGEVQLFIVPGGVHIFNFRQKAKAAVAWSATTEWFASYLKPTRADAAP